MMKIFEDTSEEYIYTKILNDEEMNTRIVNTIDDLGDFANHSTNVKADCTHGKIHKTYSEFEKLSEIIVESCHDFTYDLQHHNPNHISRYNNPSWRDAYVNTLDCNFMWGTRYKSGEITTPHDHWPATFAFTYYIDPPENCSGLIFPTMDYELKIEHGMLVIFRGNLIHETVAKDFEGYRYCIAGTVVSNPSQKVA